MALTQRLEFRQSQSLVMTPQLMQAIKLLQLSNLDLSAFVEEELERNPLLERASDGPEPPVAGEAGPERADHSDAEEAEPLRGVRRAPPMRRWVGGRLRAGAGRLAEPRPRQPRRYRADARYRPRQRLFGGAGGGRGARRAGRRADRLHRVGRRRAPRTRTTISKPLSRPKRRWPIISPSSWRSPSRRPRSA